MSSDEIKKIIRKANLNIKTRGALPRAFDQKLTPDVLRAIVKTIISFKNKEFSNKDIQESKVLKNIIQSTFGKPSPLNLNAASEYDKFVGQITNHLEFTGLIAKKGKKFIVKELETLEYIASSLDNSYNYLLTAFKEIIIESSMKYMFDNFFNVAKQDNLTYKKLRDNFVRYVNKNTNIKGVYEPRRIIGKILNILAYELGKNGSRYGVLSKQRIVWSDLLYYARKNPRDFLKKKSETRSEYIKRNQQSKLMEHKEYIAKKYMKDIYNDVSAVSKKPGVEMHHILKRSIFPGFIATYENIIPLTSQEHRQKAHPNADFSVVDLKYQKKLLKIQKQKILENSKKLSIDKFNEMLKVAKIEI